MSGGTGPRALGEGGERLDRALAAFLEAHPRLTHSWSVSSEAADALEVRLWAEDGSYGGEWLVPAEGEARRLDHYLPPDSPAGTVFDPRDDTFGPIMAAIQEGEFERAVTRLTALAHPGKRIAVLRYDVTGMSEAEVDALVGEATVQAEASDEHPDASGVDSEIVGG